jgi:hypothetical protein
MEVGAIKDIDGVPAGFEKEQLIRLEAAEYALFRLFSQDI